MIAFIVAALLVIPSVANSAPVSSIHIGECDSVGICIGRIIDNDGSVFVTRKISGVADEQQILCRNKQMADQIFDQLKEMDLADADIRERGTTTSFMTLVRGDTRQTVTWFKQDLVPGIDQISLALTVFKRAVFDLLRQENCIPAPTTATK